MQFPRTIDNLLPLDITVTDENDVVRDISTATTKQIYIKKPDGTVTAFAASFITDGSDGQLRYTLQQADKDIAGNYTVWAYVILASGRVFETEPGVFRVRQSLATYA